MLGFVYLWTNVINGKKYIGSHVGKIDDGYMGSGILFVKAIEKYGKENFVRTVLYEEYETVESLRAKELELINEFNACENDMYYNLRSHAAYEQHGPKFTEDTRKKISEFRKEYYKNPENRKKQSEIMKNKWKQHEYRQKRHKSVTSEEYIKKMREKNIGEKNPMYGKSVSEEIKRKLSKQYSGSGNPFWGKKHTEETLSKIKKKIKPRYGKDNSASVKIEVYGVVYETIKMAMSATGLSYKRINKIGRRVNENS